MKRSIQRILLIVIGISLLPLVSLAQNKYVPGFIINNNLERIEGEVVKQSDISNCQSVSFKEGEHATKYLPSQVKSWGIDGSRLFVSQTIVEDEEEKLVFLEYIVKAKVNFLAYYGVGRDPRFFVQKDNTELRELIFTRTTNSAGMVVDNKKYVGVLNIVLSDCDAVYGDISSTSFKLNNLKKLIVNYNNCVSPDDIVFEKSAKENQAIKFSVAAAFNLPKYKITNTDKDNHSSELERADSETKNYASYGINVSVQIPKVKGLSANLGAMYAQTKFAFSVVASYFPTKIVHDYIYENITLTLPLQIRYAYKISKFSPYIGAGYSFVIYAKHNSDRGFLFESQHHGWNTCVGLDYEITDLFSIFFDFGYQVVNSVGYDPPEKDYPPLDWLKLTTNTMSFRLGISF